MSLSVLQQFVESIGDLLSEGASTSSKKMVRHYNFGVEIEAVTRPYGQGESFTAVDWYRQLAQKLNNRGIDAVYDDCSKYSKHPEYYGGKWFVTRDGSLKRSRPFVCMEVVSPRLDTTLPLTRIFSDFWEAMGVHFQPQRDTSCGGHVHVTPVSQQNKFSFKTLKKVAFSIAVYEDYVASILPQSRRENHYCRPNSHSTNSGLRDRLIHGKSTPSLYRVSMDIKSKLTKRDLCLYMQGNRYVLWNFHNIYPNPKTGRCTGTIEFRGGNQFLNTKGMLAWVAFVLGFITLAVDEDLLNNFFPYASPSDPTFYRLVDDWWKRIRAAARKSKMGRYLPENWADMLSI